MNRNYSLLHPFDLEAAKRGENVCRNEGGSILKYVAGPDRYGLIVFDDNGEFLLRKEKHIAMAPLAWVEGRPVYRGDVLYWHDSHGCPVKFTAGDKMLDEILCGVSIFNTGEKMGDDGFSGVRPEDLTWDNTTEKKKVKVLAWFTGISLLYKEESRTNIPSNWVRVPNEDKIIDV